MSKRAGEFVTLDELVEEIGVDAARWYLLARSHDTTVDLDLDLAREQSAENPVYYVQYAHARIASMLDRAGRRAGRAGAVELAAGGVDGAGEPLHPSERALDRSCCSRFPGEVAEARRAPRAAPARRLRARAGPELHRLLPRLPRASAPSRAALESFRHRAVASPRMSTIARALDLLGVAAPDRDVGDPARLSRSARGRTPGAPRRPALSGARRLGRRRARARRRQRGSSTRQQRERARARARAARGRPPGRSRASRGSPSTAAPYWPTSARLICASLWPSVDQRLDVGALAVGLRRLGDVQRDLARHAHHLAFDLRQRGAGRRLFAVRDRAPSPAAATRAIEPSSAGMRARAAARRAGELIAIAPARSRGRRTPGRSRRAGDATTCPSRSTMKLSGSWSVPYARAKPPVPSRRFG